MIKFNVKRNKRADIPITILVIGVLVICLFALFSFYFSGNIAARGFDSISLVEQASVIKEKIEFYRTLGFEETEIRKIFGIKEDALGSYFTLDSKGISVKYYIGK